MPQVAKRKRGYAFLDTFGETNSAPHTTAPWLLTDFAANVWRVKTSQNEPFELDWGVQLWDGSLLTDEHHDELLRSLKHLLIIGANGVNEEFATLALVSQNMRVMNALRIVDYLLIHAKGFQLIPFGLGALNGDDLKGILNQLASTPRFADSVYQWHTRVSAFCAKALSELTQSEEEEIFARYPTMKEVSEDELEDLKLDIAVSDIPRVRAALMKAGVYYGSSHLGWRVSTKSLSKILYPDTVRGWGTPKTALHALTFQPEDQRYLREYPGVSVTTGNSEALQQSLYYNFRYTIVNSAALKALGLPCPSDTEEITDYLPKVNEPSRFRSVPSANLMKLFRKSMEFHVEHGRKVLDGFVNVANYCRAQGIPMIHITEEDFLRVIGPELVNLGVKKLGLSSHNSFDNKKNKGDRGNGRQSTRRRKGTPEKYFTDLRANHGLLELVYVYLGSIQMTVGMLMARRVDELVTLNVKKCLDESKSWLIFKLAKSTRKALGLRQRESRPIDAIAVEMIEELQRFQNQLKAAGVIDELTDLFATPSSQGYDGLRDCTLHLYNRHLDFACDYFESDLNDKSERYYVRQHQLRRFFAIMFFYTNSYGELDTLRWMLGHRDIEHVWHYLTECLEPKDIRGAGARYFTDRAKQDRLENYDNLKKLLAEKFGTTSFKLVDEQQIESYLEAMQEEGKVQIKPHFYNDENGKSMKVLFIVTEEQ
ncbi:integrase [Pseudomonas simiae]|uniref:integrase n=1 Tax=Pseudomonas simiae TaxID=321846 RepID=UPI0027341A2B|nr:integrase [Pseudomonas simiae]WLH99818.1 integrase [Pseudomonas simiae]